jgi:hypothetical protein
MYQVEVGSVYVHPNVFDDINDLCEVVIPEFFDSVLVNGTHYVVRSSQVHHAYTISFTLINKA